MTTLKPWKYLDRLLQLNPSFSFFYQLVISIAWSNQYASLTPPEKYDESISYAKAKSNEFS